MNIDTNRIRELLDQRDAIDEELQAMFTGTPKERKTVKCSVCGDDGHTARSCTKRLIATP